MARTKDQQVVVDKLLDKLSDLLTRRAIIQYQSTMTNDTLDDMFQKQVDDVCRIIERQIDDLQYPNYDEW